MTSFVDFPLPSCRLLHVAPVPIAYAMQVEKISLQSQNIIGDSQSPHLPANHIALFRWTAFFFFLLLLFFVIYGFLIYPFVYLFVCSTAIDNLYAPFSIFASHFELLTCFFSSSVLQCVCLLSSSNDIQRVNIGQFEVLV